MLTAQGQIRTDPKFEMQRREWLSESFFFECACRACEGDWPPYEELEGKNIPAKLVARLRDNEEKIREGKRRCCNEIRKLIRLESIAMLAGHLHCLELNVTGDHSGMGPGN